MPKHQPIRKLKYYCQACEKQCSDDHGYKLHCKSPSHLAKYELFKNQVHRVTQKFELEFLNFFNHFNESKTGINANKVYNEFVRQEHTHMNGTKYKNLTMFIYDMNKRNKLQLIDPNLLLIKRVEIERKPLPKVETTLIHETVDEEDNTHESADQEDREDEKDKNDKVKPKIKFKLK